MRIIKDALFRRSAGCDKQSYYRIWRRVTLRGGKWHWKQYRGSTRYWTRCFKTGVKTKNRWIYVYLLFVSSSNWFYSLIPIAQHNKQILFNFKSMIDGTITFSDMDTVWKITAICSGLVIGTVVVILWIWYQTKYKKKRSMPKIVVSNEKLFEKTGKFLIEREKIGEKPEFDRKRQ